MRKWGRRKRREGEEGRKRKKGRNSHLTHHLLSSWQLWEHLSPQMTLHMTLEAANRLIIHSTYQSTVNKSLGQFSQPISKSINRSVNQQGPSVQSSTSSLANQPTL